MAKSATARPLTSGGGTLKTKKAGSNGGIKKRRKVWWQSGTNKGEGRWIR